jgi:beta-glucosidase
MLGFETLFKNFGCHALCCRILDPLVFGDYPKTMKENVGSRLPAFTNHESKQVKGSVDFIGVVHYFSIFAKDNSNSLKMEYRDFNMDAAVQLIRKSSSVKHKC